MHPISRIIRKMALTAAGNGVLPVLFPNGNDVKRQGNLVLLRCACLPVLAGDAPLPHDFAVREAGLDQSLILGIWVQLDHPVGGNAMLVPRELLSAVEIKRDGDGDTAVGIGIDEYEACIDRRIGHEVLTEQRTGAVRVGCGDGSIKGGPQRIAVELPVLRRDVSTVGGDTDRALEFLLADVVSGIVVDLAEDGQEIRLLSDQHACHVIQEHVDNRTAALMVSDDQVRFEHGRIGFEIIDDELIPHPQLLRMLPFKRKLRACHIGHARNCDNYRYKDGRVDRLHGVRP